MEFNTFNPRLEIEQNKKLSHKFSKLSELIEELRKREIPAEIIKTINDFIDQINSFSGTDRQFFKVLNKAQTAILKLIEKELKLVPGNHFRNMWLAVGMAAFGMPIGIVFGISIGNMGMLAIGLPIGMAIGIAYGTSLDKKAKDQGLQLNIEI